MGESLTFDEAKMTEKQKRKDKYLKKRYDKSDDMKDNFKKQYGEEEGKKVYFAYIRKKAMQEDSEKKTGRVSSGATEKKRKNALLIQKVIGSSNELEGEYIPEGKDKKLSKIVKQLRKSVKSHGDQADYIEKINEKNCGCGQTPCKTYGKDVKEAKNIDDKLKKTAKELDAAVKMHTKQAERLRAMVNVKEESNPRIPRKKGQPANSKKHSDLYTDENPKGTIHGLGFKNVAKAKASVSKIRNSSRSHAHKIQAAVAMEQRAREMGKTSEAAVYRKYINSMKKKTKKMNEDVVSEEGLRDWFGKSSGTTKSGRKVRGWVQVGGKYDGKPCARQPGQKSTPKCVSSAKRASMSKKERNSAARRKRAADPNQPQKSGAAAPTMVSTDPKKKMKENYFNRKKVVESHYGSSVNKIPKELDKAVALHKSQASRLRKSDVFKKDAGKSANAIPAQLDKAVAMHTKQAKTLRAAGVSEAKKWLR